MSLIGSLFLSLVITATLATFLAAILLWSRLAGERPQVIAARAGVLLLVNAMVLLTAATQLNARYLFFADWKDLSGSAGGAVTVTTLNRGGAAAHAATQQVTGNSAAAPAVLPALGRAQIRASRLVVAQVTGQRSGLTSKVYVQLPHGYTDPANSAVRYPVIETFPGYPGTDLQWISTMDLGGALAQAAEARQIRPALIVSPQVEIPAGVDTECVNGNPGSPQIETWLAEDIPAWVAHTFRVQTTRSSWATMGFSAGGWCAAMEAMLHPEQFGAAVVMGGYFRPEFSPLYTPFPADSARATRYNLVALAQRRPPPVALWLETSHTDPTSYGSSAALLRATRAPMAVTARVLQNAGHRISVWKELLPSAIQWLGTQIPGFRAVR